MIADLAVLSLGGVSVSIYQSINREETGYILYDSEAPIVIAENEEQVAKLLSLLETPCKIPATELHPALEKTIALSKIIAIEQVAPHPLVIQLETILNDASLPATPPTNLSAIDRQALASLVYTSGTTGPPKGVMQTHANHLANVWQASLTGLFAFDGDLFLFLPLAHSFARLIGYLGFLTPAILKFPAIVDPRSSALNIPSMLQDLSEGSAQVVPCVPRILEKMALGIKEKATKPGLGGLLVGATLKSARDRFAAKRDGRSPTLPTQLLWRITTPLRKAIKRKLFGPTFQHIVSGGAKLPVPIAEFFAALEITVYEGYGLTETCVATNVNLREKNKIGSVGPCLRDIELKFTAESEILFRGPNITSGYLNRPDATREAWDSEGWFHTGDLGTIDQEGYLYITGRKKELIVTAGGKKVAPAAIEERLAASNFIANAVVVGDGMPYCSALLMPEIPVIVDWARRHNLSSDLESTAIKELFQREVDKVNETLSKFETIKRFRLLTDEFTVENGLLTPTFKVKRGVVEKRYQALIAAMYSAKE